MTIKSLALAAICLVACSTDDDLDTADLPVRGVVITPVELRPQLDDAGRPLRGTLELDTSDGRMDLTKLVPDRPREFDSWDAFHAWAIEELNAERIDTKDGRVQTQLQVAAGPTVRYDAERGKLVEVPDAIEAIVGGAAGYVVIDGKEVCVSGHAACAAEQAMEPRVRNHIPSSKRVSNSSGFEIQGDSWKTNLLFYVAVGTSTYQIRGGYQAGWVWCGFLTWCWRSSGTNTLAASFTAWRSTGSIYNGSNSATRNNVTSVTAMNYAFGVSWGTGNNGSWNDRPSPPDLGYVAATDGVCSTSSGSSGPSSINQLRTATGYHPPGGC